MVTSEKVDLIAAALAAAQAELEPAAKDAKNPMLRNNYATLASGQEAIRAVLPRHGLAYTQTTDFGEGRVSLTTTLLHASGQWISSSLPLLYGEAKGLSLMQSMGSALTYARRYGLFSIVGLATEDDDGQNAGRAPAQAPAQHRESNGQGAAPMRAAQQRGVPEGGGPKGDDLFKSWASNFVRAANDRFRADLQDAGERPADLLSYHQLLGHLVKWGTQAGRIEHRAEWLPNDRVRALAILSVDDKKAVMREAGAYVQRLREAHDARLNGEAVPIDDSPDDAEPAAGRGREPGEDG